MLHLILSSCDFRNDHSRSCIIANLKMPLDACKVLYIPNEKATWEKIESGKYHDRVQQFGFRAEHIHVFNYDDPLPFADLDIDAIYVSGGNTFRQLDRIKKCGFDQAIIRYVQNGVTYIGGSAGAHLVTKNVEHVLAFDDNATGITDFEGLGLFDGILFCHYTQARKPYYEKALAENRYKVYALSDEDSIVVDQ